MAIDAQPLEHMNVILLVVSMGLVTTRETVFVRVVLLGLSVNTVLMTAPLALV